MKQQISDARELEVVGALEGPGEGEGGEEEGRDDGGNNQAKQLGRAFTGLDEQHQRSEEDLAREVDNFPEEKARVVVAPEEAAGSGERADILLPHHRGADKEQQRQEDEGHEQRPKHKKEPEDRVELASTVDPDSTSIGRVGWCRRRQSGRPSRRVRRGRGGRRGLRWRR